MKTTRSFLLLTFFFVWSIVQGQNSSLSFNGSNTYVSLPSNIYANGVQNFTIECWIKPSSAAATGTNYHGFIGYQAVSGSISDRNPGLWLIGGEIHTDLYDQSNNRYEILTTTADLTTENWAHIAWVKSGTTQYLYVNGILLNTRSAPTGAKIVGKYTLGFIDNYLDGDIDEVRFWNVARSQTDIREYMSRSPRINETGLVAYYPFNEGTGTTLANVCTNTSSINGTLNNSPTWVTGTTNWTAFNSLIFDGTNDFLDGTLTTTNSNNITMEFWFCPKKLNVQQNLVYIRDDATTTTNAARIVAYQTSNNQLAFFVSGSAAGSGQSLIHTSTSLQLNTWYHVACIYNNGSVSLVTTAHSIVATGNSFPSFSLDGTDYLAVGADFPGGSSSGLYSNAIIDELRIWSTARTSTEIANNRYGYLDVSTTGLLAYYDFNQGIAGGTNTDIPLVLDKKGGNHLRFNNLSLSSTASNFIAQDTLVPARSNWFGESNSTWTNTANWSERVQAPKGAHLFVSTNAVNSLVLPSNFYLRTLDLPAGKSLSLNGYQLSLNLGINGTGTLVGSSASSLYFNNTPNSNTIYMAQTTAGVTNALKSLTYNTTFGAEITPGNALVILEALRGESGSFNGNGNCILRSSSSKTANAMISPDAFVTGTFTVETYFPARRAFRLFSTAINSTSTIYANWQEGGSNGAGYGTHITGNGSNGTDGTTSGSASLFTYDNAGKTWNAVTSTNNSSTDKIISGTPYRIMVRGDRTVNLSSNNATPSATVLRTTGELNVESKTVIMGSGTTANTDVMIGNPFQAPLDMGSILGSTFLNTNFKTDVMYIWDPNLGTRGAYTTVSLPTGSSTGGSSANKYLMPGQSAFLKTLNNGSASINLSRNYISNQTRSNTFLEFPEYSELKINLFQRDSLIKKSSACDGLLVQFSPEYSSQYDINDATKPVNLDEMFGIIDNQNQLYSIEKRNFPGSSDTIQLSLNKLKDARYSMVVEPLQISGFNTYLRDIDSDILHELHNVNVTQIDFDVLSPNNERRFQLIFSADQSLISDFSKDIEISVHPNPSNGKFTVQSKHYPLTDLQMFDVSGKQIIFQKQTLTKFSAEIEIHDQIAPGLYFLKTSQEAFKIQIIDY